MQRNINAVERFIAVFIAQKRAFHVEKSRYDVDVVPRRRAEHAHAEILCIHRRGRHIFAQIHHRTVDNRTPIFHRNIHHIRFFARRLILVKKRRRIDRQCPYPRLHTRKHRTQNTQKILVHSKIPFYTSKSIQTRVLVNGRTFVFAISTCAGCTA